MHQQIFVNLPTRDLPRAMAFWRALGCSTREQLDSLVRLAVAHGGSAPRPLVDHGFMVQHGFEDPDGHIWELMVMLPQAA